MDRANLNAFFITVAYMAFLQMTSLFCGTSYQISPLFLCILFIFPYSHYLSPGLTHIMLLIFFSVTSPLGLSAENIIPNFLLICRCH